MNKELLKNKNILIIGLGMIGGSYAKGLNEFGIIPYGYDINQDSLKYAIENNIVSPEIDLDVNIRKSDLVVLCLYPKNNVDWIKENQHKLKSGAIITDVSGVKEYILNEVESFLRTDLQFVSSHPMAGRETSGILISDNKVFHDANYIIVPGKAALEESISLIKGLAEVLKFKNIEVLDAKSHDELISYLSQLTHVIAISLMNSHHVEEMIRFTGDSFRDLTRIAKINEKLWTELFLLNKEQLIKDIDAFSNELNHFKELLITDSEQKIKEKMINSTEKRKLFDKNSQK